MSTWKCLYYAFVCCLGSHTFKCPVGGICSLPHTSSRWTESNRFLWMSAQDSPVHTRQALFTIWCPATSADRWGLQQATVGSNRCQTVRCTQDSPVLQPESARCGPLCADCPGIPPDSLVHTGQGIVHCSVHHQGAGWLPTSWISLLILWYCFVLESWTSKLFLCLLLRCYILSALVQSSSHSVNYKHKH
jgi:hypothetical protein